MSRSQRPRPRFGQPLAKEVEASTRGRKQTNCTKPGPLRPRGNQFSPARAMPDAAAMVSTPFEPTRECGVERAKHPSSRLRALLGRPCSAPRSLYDRCVRGFDVPRTSGNVYAGTAQSNQQQNAEQRRFLRPQGCPQLTGTLCAWVSAAPERLSRPGT